LFYGSTSKESNYFFRFSWDSFHMDMKLRLSVLISM
jgi:hypothetical protein